MQLAVTGPSGHSISSAGGVPRLQAAGLQWRHNVDIIGWRVRVSLLVILIACARPGFAQVLADHCLLHVCKPFNHLQCHDIVMAYGL